MKIFDKIIFKIYLKRIFNHNTLDNIFRFFISFLFIIMNHKIITKNFKMCYFIFLIISNFGRNKIINLGYILLLLKYNLLKIESISNSQVVITMPSGWKIKNSLEHFSLLSFIPPPLQRKLFKQLIKKGSVVIDVGANIGGYTLFFAKLVGKHGKVIAFEPVKDLFRILKFNVENAGYRNIICEMKALSDSEYIANIALSDTNIGDNRVQYGNFETKSTIICTSLDKYIQNKNLRINFIKIDVQGYEYKVFKGMQDLLKYQEHIIVFSEFWPYGIKLAGDEPINLLKLILSLGFKIYEVDWKKNQIFIVNDIYGLIQKYNVNNEWCDLLLIK
jgi:FkbM family methyltransferase